jgi:hypothetical protein
MPGKFFQQGGNDVGTHSLDDADFIFHRLMIWSPSAFSFGTHQMPAAQY